MRVTFQSNFISLTWHPTGLWGSQARVKSVKWIFLKILFYWDVTPGHIKKRYHMSYFWAPPEEPSGIFWGRHIWCTIFRRIFWYHSLVPQKCFSGVIQDLGSFLEFPFWPITRKRLIFEIWFRFWAPIFFHFLSDGLFNFWVGWGFLKTFPIMAIQSPRSSLNLTRSENIFVLEKTVVSVNFHFRAMNNGGWDGCRNGGCKQWRKATGSAYNGWCILFLSWSCKLPTHIANATNM